MLGHRRRRWPSITAALGSRIVVTGRDVSMATPAPGGLLCLRASVIGFVDSLEKAPWTDELKASVFSHNKPDDSWNSHFLTNITRLSNKQPTHKYCHSIILPRPKNLNEFAEMSILRLVEGVVLVNFPVYDHPREVFLTQFSLNVRKGGLISDQLFHSM